MNRTGKFANHIFSEHNKMADTWGKQERLKEMRGDSCEIDQSVLGWKRQDHWEWGCHQSCLQKRWFALGKIALPLVKGSLTQGEIKGC